MVTAISLKNLQILGKYLRILLEKGYDKTTLQG